ncbi:MAG TPA: kelch repeat-containing protein [Candidatus Acidoferrum sp.]|nr:kelch repeat-containing protein [Candidatus Acidoferrum sp.]
MPTARASLVTGHAGNNVYAIGGTDGVSVQNVNEVYDISHDSWSSTTPMPTARQEAGVHSHGGRIYVVGGATPAVGSSTNANEVFKP